MNPAGGAQRRAADGGWPELGLPPRPEPQPPEPGAGSAPSPARGLMFVASFLLAWVSTNPFPSLGDARWLDPASTGELTNQLGYLTLGACACVVMLRDRFALRALMRPAYGLMLAWLIVSVATSSHPSLSLRRLGFALCVIALGAAVPLLPTSRERFCDLLALVATVVLVLCFAGVALMPDLAIHQITDLVEPRLAGNWRGIFYHKNVAGEMMGIFVFVGLFVARVRSLVIGGAIVAAALAFLFFTEAKSAMGFLPLTLLLAWTSRRGWSVALRLAAFFVVVAGLNTLGIGSILSPTIAGFAERHMSDPTFTGRTEIWQLALDYIPKRPVFGYGYGAFWQTDEVMFAKSSNDGLGAAMADHAHNAVLNLAVTIGIPGAVLALLWALVLPLKDLAGCLRRQTDPALTNLFLRIWAFALANCSFESILFARGDAMWFTMLVAMFGLRYLAVLGLNGGDRRSG